MSVKSRLKITVGEDSTVTIVVGTSSNPIVARALLIEGPLADPTRIVLDRPIHTPGKDEFHNYHVSGVVSDIRKKNTLLGG